MDLIDENKGRFTDLVYEAKLVDCLRERAMLLHNAESDPLLRACVIRMCKEDPKYFFETFLYTVKNSIFFSDVMPTNIPFKLFDYQGEMVDMLWYAITRQRSVFIEKSRQMSVTWVVLGLYLYGFLFHDHRYLIISRTANEVDHKGDMKSCFERLRYMISLLPTWILPEGFDRKSGGEHNKYMSINRPDGVGSISGETANSDAGRGGTYTSVFMDEMAFMKDAKTINNAVSSATPCRIMNSTPHGEKNEYFEMRKLTRMLANKPFAERGIIGIKLLWDLHPYYTDEWYKWYTETKTEEQIQQELLINYNVSLEGRVYKEFDQAPIGRVDFGDYDYDYSLPFYVSIDNSHGGQDPFALICAQVDKYGKIRIFDCIESNLAPTNFAEMLSGRPTVKLNQSELEFMERFTQYKTPVFIADPNDTDAKMDKTSIRKIFKSVGINIVTPKLIQNTKEGKGRIETQVQLVKQNMDRFQVNIPQCDPFISAIQNATYPKRSDDSQSTTDNNVPVHNWTSHYRTALEYLVMYLCETEKTIGKREVTVEIPDYVTGEIKKKLLQLNS